MPVTHGRFVLQIFSLTIGLAIVTLRDTERRDVVVFIYGPTAGEASVSGDVVPDDGE